MQAIFTRKGGPRVAPCSVGGSDDHLRRNSHVYQNWRNDLAGARPAWLQVIRNLAGVVGITLLVPFAVVGLPLALAWRAILDATKWRSDSHGALGR